MKRPTQVDVAKLAGVSRSTVSYVINGQTNGRVNISAETEQRVLEAVSELGYMPDAQAQALRSGSTQTIGVTIPPDYQNPHFWEYIDGIESVAQEAGYRLLITSSSANLKHKESNLLDLTRRRLDGLIIQGFLANSIEHTNAIYSQLFKRKLPFVVVGETHANVDSIWEDYQTASHEVMNYLFSLGHRRIGFVYGVIDPILGEDRLIPYKEKLHTRRAYRLMSPSLSTVAPQ